MKRLTPWIGLTFAAIALVYSLTFFDGRAVVPALFFFICFLAYFYCTPLAQKRETENWRQRKEAAIETEKQSLADSEAAIRAHLAAGELRYLVECWEEDILEIDENHHLLFIFTDGAERDFTLYEPIEQKLVFLLAENGIIWHPRFNLHFGSVIIYPPDLRGQQFYTPDGDIRNEFVQ